MEHGNGAEVGNILWHCSFGTAEMERFVSDLDQGWVILLLGKKKL